MTPYDRWVSEGLLTVAMRGLPPDLEAIQRDRRWVGTAFGSGHPQDPSQANIEEYGADCANRNIFFELDFEAAPPPDNTNWYWSTTPNSGGVRFDTPEVLAEALAYGIERGGWAADTGCVFGYWGPQYCLDLSALYLVTDPTATENSLSDLQQTIWQARWDDALSLLDLTDIVILELYPPRRDPVNTTQLTNHARHLAYRTKFHVDYVREQGYKPVVYTSTSWSGILNGNGGVPANSVEAFVFDEQLRWCLEVLEVPTVIWRGNTTITHWDEDTVTDNFGGNVYQTVRKWMLRDFAANRADRDGSGSVIAGINAGIGAAA